MFPLSFFFLSYSPKLFFSFVKSLLHPLPQSNNSTIIHGDNSVANPPIQLLKLEWWRLTRERNQAKSAEAAQYLGGMDADLMAQEEEELRMLLQIQQQQQQLPQQQRQYQQQYQQQYQPQRSYVNRDTDAMMADAIVQQEEAELEALVSGLEGKGDSAHFSDDEDYDGLFMDLIQQQQQQQQQEDGAGMGAGWSQDVEMT